MSTRKDKSSNQPSERISKTIFSVHCFKGDCFSRKNGQSSSRRFGNFFKNLPVLN